MAAFQGTGRIVPVWWLLRCMRQSPVFDLSEVRQMTAGENCARRAGRPLAEVESVWALLGMQAN